MKKFLEGVVEVFSALFDLKSLGQLFGIAVLIFIGTSFIGLISVIVWLFF